MPDRPGQPPARLTQFVRSLTGACADGLDRLERCEWNPATDTPALAVPDGSRTGCSNPATVSLGRGGDWHLCESCAARAVFRAFRVRIPLRRGPGPAHA
jgi:hypothetical protein